MVVENVNSFIKDFGLLKASDVPALEAVIEAKENELEKATRAARADIESMKTLLEVLRKRFGLGKAPKQTNRGKRGETTQKVIDFLSNQDFPVGVSTIAASLEMSKAAIYHQMDKLEAQQKVKRLGDGWEIIRGAA